MGRELKRVALDFDWPLNIVWRGYICPYESQRCDLCRGTGDRDGVDCSLCKGEGVIWFSDKIKELDDRWWQDERYDPPVGEGYQLWEDVTEGSPISPVFSTEDEFVSYLVEQGYSEKAAREFVRIGWTPSMAFVGGRFYKDIESAAL